MFIVAQIKDEEGKWLLMAAASDGILYTDQIPANLSEEITEQIVSGWQGDYSETYPIDTFDTLDEACECYPEIKELIKQEEEWNKLLL